MGEECEQVMAVIPKDKVLRKEFKKGLLVGNVEDCPGSKMLVISIR